MSEKTRVSLSSISYQDLDDKSILGLIAAAKKGFTYAAFVKVLNETLFSQEEWAGFLNTTVRTLQRYQVEKKVFDLPKSERILQITLLNKRGHDLFGDAQKFHVWLDAENVALGRIKPKSLLNSSLGIGLLMDELTRIEHGVLA
jgi:putative toxin-antitoxin system antitoxin component (TIGR02293 family)